MSETTSDWLQHTDSQFLAILRAFSIFIIVFGHVGGFWIYRPWSEFLHVFVPIFFFISGAVSYNGFLKRKNIFQYLTKRITGLIIPYYGVCILCLFIYILIHRSLPLISLTDFIKWGTITPIGSPFPLAQVWFLKTLMTICIVSPFFFFLYRRCIFFLIIFMLFATTVSAIQLIHDIRPFFEFWGHNFFMPLIHSLFYCLGFLIFDLAKLRSTKFLAFMVASLTSLSVLLVKTFNLNPDFSEGHLAPDFYYVSGSLCAIGYLLLLQRHIIFMCNMLPGLLSNLIDFFFRHTFSIFLLHSFAIYTVEGALNFINYHNRSISYGIFKLFLVIILTMLISPFFTKITALLTDTTRKCAEHLSSYLLAVRAKHTIRSPMI